MVLLSGCASQWQEVPAVYAFTDQPDQDRIKLSYTNDTNRQVCLLPEHWPNKAGKMNQANSVFLVVDDTKYPVEYFNTGFCQGCSLAVQPGETVTAFIAYADFALPEALHDAPKQIEIPAIAFTCR